jgi:hypothetical protein
MYREKITESSPIFLGLNFLLSHLSKPEFPRTVATLLTGGKQVVVNSNIEALAYYKEANFYGLQISSIPLQCTEICTDN